MSSTGADPTFQEDAASASLFSSTSIDDADSQASQTFATLTFTVTNVQDTTESIYLDGAWVTLAAMGSTDTTTTNSFTYQITGCSTTCTVSLTGMTATAAQLESMIDGLLYRNTDDSPTDADRVVTFTELTDSGASDGDNDNSLDPSAITSTVDVELTNDAPDASGGSGALAAIDEDATDPAGDAISDILSGVTDADSGSSINGIVILSLIHI